jgi:polyribonucleotide nucleotidyltransferase
MNSTILSPYQILTLKKYGIDPEKFLDYSQGEKTDILEKINAELSQQINSLDDKLANNSDSQAAKETNNFQVITDITGEEDHFGDMDFKVAGARDGVTAIQLDNKVSGLTPEILKQAIMHSKKARNYILDKMDEAISQPKPKISELAPKVSRIIVPMAKIGEVIGSGGKTINGMQTEFGVSIDLDNDTGVCFVYGKVESAVNACTSKILALIKEYEIGEQVLGKVWRIESFGAFVKILDQAQQETTKEGMIHISNFGRRIPAVADVVKIGDVLACEILEINEKGQIAMKARLE